MAHTFNQVWGETYRRDPADQRPLVQVESKSTGIGDNLLTLTIAEGLRRKHPDNRVAMVAAGWMHPWLRMFGGWDVLTTTRLPGSVYLCDNSWGVKGKFDRAGVPRWRWWADELGVEPSVPTVPPLSTELEEKKVPYIASILLAPIASHANRTWPLEKWLEVERLLLANGFLVGILDGPSKLCEQFITPYKLLGHQPDTAVAMVRASAVLVGNDSGMAHVAGMSGTPSVVVTTPASDRGIMGIYPDTTSLTSERTSPEEVVERVTKKVNQSIYPGFPLQEFLEILHPEDQWRRYCWPPVYAALWSTVKKLNPQTIVEIGTRAGVSAWTMLRACPETRINTIDLPEPGDGGVPWGPEHARKLLDGRNVTFHIADSQTLERLPVLEPDMVYVDGDHSEQTAYSDLCLAERSGAKAVLIDDVVSHPLVRIAVQRFSIERPYLKVEFIPSQTGLMLLTGWA